MTNQEKGNDKEKSGWGKAEIILSPVGGLLTALAVAATGFYGTRYLNSRQETETNQRVYAELMSQRESADVQLRKDMFESIIKTFLTSTSGQPKEDVLKLELLAYNFHDSLDLGPLFKQVYQDIDTRVSAEREKQSYLERLQRVAGVVTGWQISALREPGQAEERPVDLQQLDSKPAGFPVYEGDMRLPPVWGAKQDAKDPDYQPRHFMLELLRPDRKTREILVRLRVTGPGSSDMKNPEVDKNFWVGFFDFPMIDNTRLTHDQRCSVVLNDFDPQSNFAQVTIVFFPGDRASLKEKPYYDEVLHTLYRAQANLAQEGK